MLRLTILFIFSTSAEIMLAKPESTPVFWYQHRVYSSPYQELSPSQIMVFRDDSNALKYKDVSKYDNNYFIALNQIDLFEKHKTYWVKLSLVNSTETVDDFVLSTGNNAYSTVYVEQGERIDTLKMGYFVPVEERDIKQGFQSRFKISMRPGESVNLLIKTRSLDNYPPRFDFNISTFDHWQKRKENKNVLEGVFTGLLLVLALLGLSFYLYVKRIEFLFYGLYALSNAVYFLFYHGFLDIYLFPSNPQYLSFLWILPNLTAAFYFSFARYFLNTKDNYPKWDFYFKRFIWLVVVAFLANSIYVTLTLDVFNAVVIHNVINMTLSTIVVIFILSLKKLYTVEIKYFTLASVFLITITIFASAQYILNLDADIVPYVQVGASIEILFFALGLGHKMKKLFENHSVTQESLIIQLIENEKLQSKINLELKEKVAERTHQINVQNSELKKARLEAEKATKSKSDFLSVMSHEIRTPLNAIISLSHLMDIDNENEETQEYIDALKFSAESLSSLINDILDYNKIEAGKLRLESIDFSLIDLLKNIRESFKFKASSKNVALNFGLAENTPDKLIGDPTRLTQIFNNLISNALKFTDDGSVDVGAKLVGIIDEKVTLEFTVADTGIGIPEEKIDEIFKDYEQASSDTTRKYGGTGLGLAITKKLLEMYNGDISVSSKPNVGTEFKFKIEFELPESFDILAADKANTVDDLKMAKILVVDDNYMNRMVLKRLFQKWNGDFYEASNGQQACEMANDHKFNLILMDLQMDEMDGFECSEIIKSESSQNQTTQILGLTAFGKNESISNKRAHYFEEFIAKPFDPKELLKKLVLYLNNEQSK